MNLKTAFIGLAGVLAIPAAIALKEVNFDMTVGKAVADSLAGKSAQVDTKSEEKTQTPEIKNLPGLGKFKLDKYEEPKQP